MSRNIPVIMSAPMVRAMWEGRKTMTRRLLYVDHKTPKGGPRLLHSVDARGWQMPHWPPAVMLPEGRCWDLSGWEKVKPGDRLWVRESFGFDWFDDGNTRAWKRPVYRADNGAAPSDNGSPVPWTPSIHMPRELSRLTLIVTATKIEPLQKISEKDAAAEGCEEDWADGLPVWFVPGANMPRHKPTGARCFQWLWESLHGAGSWDENPDVVAITFCVVKANIDAPEAQVA